MNNFDSLYRFFCYKIILNNNWVLHGFEKYKILNWIKIKLNNWRKKGKTNKDFRKLNKRHEFNYGIIHSKIPNKYSYLERIDYYYY